MKEKKDPKAKTFLHLETITNAEKDAIFWASRRAGQHMEEFCRDGLRKHCETHGVKIDEDEKNKT